MKRALMWVLMIYAVAACADESKARHPAASEVTHVATALDHLTVLEFGEPITMAATGSAAFQIERHDDKVFIKPLKRGASTDLFVWTASRRFTYELETAGEETNMTFAVDNRIPAPKPAPDSGPLLDEVADMLLTRAFLGVERVDNTGIKDVKGRVTIRIEHVFRSKNTLYIHYSVRNLSARPYRVLAPAVTEALAPRATISVMSLQHVQLDEPLLRKLGELRQRPMIAARSETQKEDLLPGEETQGVVAIREQVAAPAILQVTFGPEGPHPVQATMVF